MSLTYPRLHLAPLGRTTAAVTLVACFGGKGGASEHSESEQDTQPESVDTGWIDVDGDGYGLGVDDCNDANADVHPGADEVCNDVDDDCDGKVDDEDTDLQ